MIDAMSAPTVLRAPVAHRVAAAMACPVVAYFVARLLLRLTGLPPWGTYGVCLALGVLIGYRALSARVELRPATIRVLNSLASSTSSRETVRRVSDSGRIESRDVGSRRTTHLPADALHQPWWAFGNGRATYSVNREQVRGWLRLEPARTGQESADGTAA